MNISPLAMPSDNGPDKGIDASGILAALPAPVLVVGPDGDVIYANGSAESLLQISASQLYGSPLGDFFPADSPLASLVEQVRTENSWFTEYDVTIESPRIGRHLVNIQASPLPDAPDNIVIVLHERSVADKIARQLTSRGSARTVASLASMLAHEVKNPLSGIRGAAQLIEQHANDDDRVLTRLICDETDRICDLVDRMDVFADRHPSERTAVNIHRVLEHARRVAENGFAAHVKFVEIYDPSLPPVYGNRDQLIQVVLNLLKNAAEAAPDNGGEIVIRTSYQHGIRFAVPGSNALTHLPLIVTIQDNGSGIPEDIKTNLFDPFVTTKPKGSGLGLALVAKIINDHGGIIECDSKPKRTIFRVMLPVYKETENDGEES
ncbi:MAG: ATP-binding protein [Rhodospirillales bacterium]|nr:ATP-binding protein [Rhodospirillales bacterium]MCW8862931.1 ATP-binding protein [Rhodospirillales bacterium]MCW8952631.1 ATP-binding protein [Rhodospirillales bacterium]MCW8970839.1 ATP-binding protein [Rhodospirillales bacterium]MCW9003343.1 ATP-binding protein [Rhodospirillales bacterium]